MNRSVFAPRVIVSTRNALLLVASYFFLTLGFFGLGYVAYNYFEAHHYQATQMKQFEMPAIARQVNLPTPRVVAEGDMLGQLQVPRLGLNAIVVEGDSHAALKHAVGHLRDTALPGELGNVALAGHRDSFFRPLRDIQLGDEIRFNTLQRSYKYRVDAINVVRPREVGILKSSTGRDLTLVTCYPIYYVGPAPKRLIVHAREIENTAKPQPASQSSFAPLTPSRADF
jgi:sortase A